MKKEDFMNAEAGMLVQITAMLKADEGKRCRIVSVKPIKRCIVHQYERPFSSGKAIYGGGWERGEVYEYITVGKVLTIELIDPEEIFVSKGARGKRTMDITACGAVHLING